MIFLSMVSMTSFSQKKEFDVACRIIQNLHSFRFTEKKYKKYNRIIIDSNISDGDIDIILYLRGKIECDTLNDIINNESRFKNYYDRIVKPSKDFDPKESKYFSWRNLKNLKDGIKISFVKFDGKFLRLDALIGHNIFSNTIENAYIEYQFVFINGEIIQLDWVERKH